MSRNSRRHFFQDLGWTSLGMGVAMLIDFVFFLAVGRLLGPEKFGLFGVFTSLYYILIRAPSDSIEMTVKKLEADTGDAIQQIGLKSVYLGFLVALILLVASPVLTSWLNLRRTAFLAFLVTFPLAYITAVLMSVIQVQERFDVYAAYEVLSSIAKFSVVLLVLAGFGLTAAVLGHAFEIILGFIILYIVLRPSFDFKKFQGRSVLFRSFVYILALNLVFSVDIIFLQLFSTAETVGLYNTVAVIGKGVFFASVAINRSVFPKFARGVNKFLLLKLTLLVLFLQGIAAFSFFHMFGEQFISMTFGQDYVNASEFAAFYMVFISALSACGVLGNYYLARGSEKVKTIALVPIIQIFLMFYLPVSALNVILAGIIASIIVFFLMLIPILKEYLGYRKTGI